MKRIVLSVLSIIMVLILTSCYGEYRISEEECVGFTSRNSSIQCYSNKVVVKIKYGSNDDELRISTYGLLSDDTSDWLYDTKCILTDIRFDKVAWVDYVLFINNEENNEFYEFNIKDYEPPESKKENVKYNLIKYNADEFKSKYPDYKKYEWYR